MVSVSGWDKLQASEHCVLKVNVLKAGKKGKCKDLNEFDKGLIAKARRLGQSICKTAAVVRCSLSAVVSIYQKCSWKEQW